MLIVGIEHLEALRDGRLASAKMVFNERGAIVIPVSVQHRDAKVSGISYEDEYKGDAMAAMLAPGKIEIRFHKAFSDRDVGRIVRALVERPEMAFMAGWRVTYQGREVSVGPVD